MNRTSRDTERKVFQLHFKGDSNCTIAFKLGIPHSTVSDILTLLLESIAPLEDLSKDLKKQNLTVFEAKKGTELRARLKDLGVELEQLESFVESAEKMRTNPDYGPKQVIQGAMKLNELEKSGKTYAEVLVDFKEKNDSIKKLETKEHELTEKTKTLEIERKRKLAENNVTEREIAYTINIRQSLRKYDVELSDVESLKKYLENMQETNGNPKMFAEYTREHGSLIERTAKLQQMEQAHTLNLQSLTEKEEHVQASLNKSLSTKSDLDQQNQEEQAKLLAARRDTAEVQQKEVEELEKLGHLLNVEAQEKKITEALAVKKARLDKLDNEIVEKQARAQSLEQKAMELKDKNRKIENEIQVKLGINDSATQGLSALAELERERLSLAKANDEKKERIAVADTLTVFLTKQTLPDFNRFYSYVEQIRTMRDSKTYQTSFHLTVAEEQTRMLALEAFKGHLVTTGDYYVLQCQKGESDKANAELGMKVRQLESLLRDSENKLESAQKGEQFAEAVRANFEGRATTIGEIRNWVLQVFSEEIQKKANGKFDATAALMYETLDFAFKKITHKNNTPTKSEG